MVKDFFRKHISVFFRVACCLLVFGIAVKIVAVCSPAFADFFNRYISSVSRAVLGYATSVFPFSVAEAVVIAAIPASLLYIIYCIVSVLKRGRILRHIFNLLGVIFILISVFLINFSIAYDCTPIEEKLSYETGKLTVNDVYDAGCIVLEEIWELEAELERDESGMAIMPYSYGEMNKRLLSAYEKLYDEYDFIAPMSVATKRVALSKLMTYTHTSGVYTVFTGEANVNTNYSDYVIPSTAAHEMAHQRGIAPEDEANFVGFLACYNSDDPFLKYCGLMEVFNYIASAIYEEDEELYIKLMTETAREIVDEFMNQYEQLEPYEGNAVGEVSTAVNDAYLKSQGEKEGTKSYGLVVDLATAYFLTGK